QARTRQSARRSGGRFDVKHDKNDGNVRNLDQIQEEDPGPRSSKLGALVLASLGGACIVFSAIALLRAPPKPKIASADPLGDLVARAHPAGANGDALDAPHDVTFPQILSDAKRPTTALESARDGQPAAFPFHLPRGAPPPPPLAPARLPVVPLPAQDVLQTQPPEVAPGDTLSAMAHHVARDDGAEVAPAGG